MVKPLPKIENATLPPRLTIEAACKVIGGDRPVHKSTYYRGVARGVYPAPVNERVNARELLAALRLRR
jgi:hypothetical protein